MRDDVYSRGFSIPIIQKFSRSLTHNNIAELSGQISSQITIHHECYDQTYYHFIIRTLGYISYALPVIVNKSICQRAETIAKSDLVQGVYIEIPNGAWRSYNEIIDHKTKLSQSLFAKKIIIVDRENCQALNKVFLDGYICRGGHPEDPRTIYMRTTPHSGREIVDVLIAINRPRGPVNRNGFTPTKTDYLPLLFWDELAEEASMLQIGDRIQVEALMQSRYYEKLSGHDAFSYPIFNKHIAYELSALRFRVVDEQVDK